MILVNDTFQCNENDIPTETQQFSNKKWKVKYAEFTISFESINSECITQLTNSLNKFYVEFPKYSTQQ